MAQLSDVSGLLLACARIAFTRVVEVETRGEFGASTDAGLVEHALEVVADRVRRQVEPRADLGIGEPTDR